MMTRRTITLWGSLLSLTWLLSSCAAFSDNSRPQAWLKPGVRVTLPPASITPAINEQQLLTSTIEGKSQSLLVLLNADADSLSLVGLSSLGIRLFMLTYDEQGIHTEQSIVLPSLPPANQVLADIMLSYWPLTAWQSQLPKGWTLRDNGERRELRDNQGELVSEMIYQTEQGLRRPISVRQHVFGYHITIQHLDS